MLNTFIALSQRITTVGHTAVMLRWSVDIGQKLPLQLEEWLLLCKVKSHILLLLIIHMQLCEDGLHHSPVELALCHVLHSTLKLSKAVPMSQSVTSTHIRETKCTQV